MTTGTHEIAVGTVLRDTYEITRLLGRGGMGAVFAARHLRLPAKQVAVKVLHGGSRIDPGVYARFRREAEIASRLGHPNIVEVLDFDTLGDGTPFLVLEYLSGESLADRLQRGPLPVEAAMPIARQIASALNAAHRASVIHRDLKPANIFLVPTDSGGIVGHTVKVLDFGISKIKSGVPATVETQDAMLVGTPQYMSPEQARGRNREIDARTDLFALGCVVYEMVAGRPAFAGEGLAQVVFKVVHEEPTPLTELRPDLPPRVVAAVARALRKDPAERYGDVAAFVVDLTGVPLQTLPPAAPSGGAGPLPQPTTEPDAFAATAASGPKKPPTPATQPPIEPTLIKAAAGRPVWRAAALGAAALVLLVALGVWAGALRRGAPAEPGPRPPAATASPQAAAAGATARPGDTGAGARPAAKPADRSRGEAPEEIPEAAKRDLDGAQQAMDRGDGAEAVRLARRSQLSALSGLSYAVLVRAHCLRRDLSNAKALWPKVPAAHRAPVKGYCKGFDIDL